MTQGTRSLQCALNTIIPKTDSLEQTVTKAAYSKARHKLKHTAFIELNQKAVVRAMYEDGDYKTWHGLRILGNDGSKIVLPTTDAVAKEFGTVPYNNGQGNTKDTGFYCEARASVLYDVLNRVALDSVLAPGGSGETDLAILHFPYLQVNDLVIRDRGYASFRMLALHSQIDTDYLIRCPKGRFTIATAMLMGEGPDDVICEIEAPKCFLASSNSSGLPTKLAVRFVRVKLDDGSNEVLVTSLLDESKVPAADFKELYYLRWGIETFFGILKTRLGLENFTGYSPEAIRQDFFATVYLTGIETMLTMDAEGCLRKQTGGQPKKVNKAVSFSIIREHAFDILYSHTSDEQKVDDLTKLFTTSPTVTRKDRNPIRKNTASHRTLKWWKRMRKSGF